MEWCIHKHIINYLITHSVISPFQSGFQSGDSAVNQLLPLCNEFSKALDESKEIRAVFHDISKAVDKVWHQELIFKLRSVGISGSLLGWITDYLANGLASKVLCHLGKNICRRTSRIYSRTASFSNIHK